VKPRELGQADELIPTRQSLLSRLKNREDEESWRVFFETYWRLIYRTAVKAGLGDAEAQDVVQETVLSVLKAMPEFKYRAVDQSFKSWLLRLTRWRIGDQIRKRGKFDPRPFSEPGKDSSTATEGAAIESIVDPAGLSIAEIWESDWEMNLMEAAIDRVKKKVDPKMYQIFDLYVYKEWTVSRVAQALSVNPAQVYLAKHRVGNLIKKEVKRLQAEPLNGVPFRQQR
jgi:RNA polymerase sigma factor (sigma-70 family)